MKKITKYKSIDGDEFDNEQQALERDELVKRVEDAMNPLGERPDNINDGWIQHDIKDVIRVKCALLELAKPIFKSFTKILKAIEDDPESIHPMSSVGRVLDDCGGPINYAWGRLCCIDAQGREHNQPYFAINGPDKGHKQLMTT